MGQLISDYAQWLAGVGAGLTAAILVWRLVVPTIARFGHKINQVFEVMLGRDEIRHPDTDEVLAEATPPLGARFALMEEAILQLSQSHRDISSLTERIVRLELLAHKHPVIEEPVEQPLVHKVPIAERDPEVPLFYVSERHIYMNDHKQEGDPL